MKESTLMQKDCLFCKILQKQIPSKMVGESDFAFAFRDIHPQAPEHILVVPKEHVASLNDLSSEQRLRLLPHLYELADRCAADLGFRDRGYRTVINNQALAGQTVYHLHLHVLAGTALGTFGV
jgi:histidine triad (HIT) family protein